MSNKMLEVKKLKDFMEERGIQEGEQFAMLPLTNWYMFDDLFLCRIFHRGHSCNVPLFLSGFRTNQRIRT